MALLVSKGGGQYLKGGGDWAAPRYVDLARTLVCNGLRVGGESIQVGTNNVFDKKSIIVQATGAFDGPGLVATGFSDSARHNVTNVQGRAGFQSCVPFGKH